MHKLTSLRQQFTDIKLKIAAIESAMVYDKVEGLRLATELNCIVDSDNTQQIENDLSAINDRFLLRKAEISKLKLVYMEAWSQIECVYEEACLTGSGLDYIPTLINGKVYSGWDHSSSDGKHCVINAELCEAEVEFLRKLCNVSKLRLVTVRGTRHYRLLAEYPAYRDTCWTEYGGAEILERMSALFIAKEKREKTNAFLDSLAVLK